MSNNGVEQIVIRHLSGSKANQIEHISLADVNEITIGRDPKSNIAFDSSRDDIVSRRHAVICVVRGDQISFRLADLGSNNGTFLNGERITEEVELLPEDSIELGKNGVKFIFDVQPRPANLVARTRVIDISDAAATRVIKTAGIAARDAVSTSDMDIEPAIQKFEPPPKVGVGKETVLHLLGEERRATSRVWISSLAGFAAFVALGGGAFYWKQIHDQNAAEAELQLAKEEMVKNAASLESQQAALEKKTAEDRAQVIVEQFGNATARIDRHWRLYDQTTGKPVFHRTFNDHDVDSEGKLVLPAYVQLPGNLGIHRWLTLEDNNRANIEIGGEASGTGFVVDETGFMLTNKHVAAAWNLRFEEDPANHPPYGYGWLYNYGDVAMAKDGKKAKHPRKIVLGGRDYNSLQDWVPAYGGIIFKTDVAQVVGPGNIPNPSTSENRTFFGRNDVLEVRFANSRGRSSANLVRFSNDSDAALIKVDTPQQLKTLDIAADDPVTAGEQVIAIGYPSVAEQTVATSTTIENGQLRTNTDIVPVPFVSVGNVAVISSALKTEKGVTVGGGQTGDVIQMSINSTGEGNSGGPVFNKAGKVIGLFTYRRSGGGANTTEAIPIKYGQDLLQSQHP